jgi:hypothetical protein
MQNDFEAWVGSLSNRNCCGICVAFLVHSLVEIKDDVSLDGMSKDEAVFSESSDPSSHVSPSAAAERMKGCRGLGVEAVRGQVAMWRRAPSEIYQNRPMHAAPLEFLNFIAKWMIATKVMSGGHGSKSALRDAKVRSCPRNPFRRRGQPGPMHLRSISTVRRPLSAMRSKVLIPQNFIL